MLKRQLPSLRQGLDRDIYQIILKLEIDGSNPARLTTTSVYESIKHSNSSLARQKKRPLEDAIDRVLEVRREEIKADQIDDDSDQALEATLEEDGSSRDASLLNRQLTKHWNFGMAASSQADRMDLDKAPRMDRQLNGEPKAKRRRAKEAPDRSPPTGITLADIAGLDEVMRKLIEPLGALCLGEDFANLGNRGTRTILLHGPSGCGKTALANAAAATIGVSYIPISGPSMIGGVSGESEKNIRDVFDEAIKLAPCLIFLDEVDSIAGKRESTSKAMEGRMITEICHGLDKISWSRSPGKFVVVLAATNSPDSIEPVVRRRFSSEINIGMPTEEAREQILRTMTRETPLAADVDFKALAKLTPGFVGADLKHAVEAAQDNCFRVTIEQKIRLIKGDQNLSIASHPAKELLNLLPRIDRKALDGSRVTFEHLRQAVASVQPAARREGFSTIPDTTWAHVGAMQAVREELEMTIIGPIKNPDRYAKAGIKPAAGILLWGPPGCGKTLVAKAVANESTANFISIKGPELLSKWVGESERSVRQLFSRAHASAPCILFFDEMDALVPTRDDSTGNSSTRVVNALLTELDGVGDRSGIYVIGATNRVDIIDPALKRPGRLGTSIFVGLPAPEERVEILRTLYRNAIPKSGMNDNEISERLRKVALDPRCAGFSGADLGNLLQAAGKAALKRSTGHPVIVVEDWEKALNEIKPSVKNIDSYNGGR